MILSVRQRKAQHLLGLFIVHPVVLNCLYFARLEFGRLVFGRDPFTFTHYLCLLVNNNVLWVCILLSNILPVYFQFLLLVFHICSPLLILLLNAHPLLLDILCFLHEPFLFLLKPDLPISSNFLLHLLFLFQLLAPPLVLKLSHYRVLLLTTSYTSLAVLIRTLVWSFSNGNNRGVPWVKLDVLEWAVLFHVEVGRTAAVATTALKELNVGRRVGRVKLHGGLAMAYSSIENGLITVAEFWGKLGLGISVVNDWADMGVGVLVNIDVQVLGIHLLF